jgi:hypothetical protein
LIAVLRPLGDPARDPASLLAGRPNWPQAVRSLRVRLERVLRCSTTDILCPPATTGPIASHSFRSPRAC